jgi:hypothetical protein
VKARKKAKALDLKYGPDFIQAILIAAENHGKESDPEHEVGDLQDLVWYLWLRIPGKCRDEIMSSEQWQDFIADHGGAS